MFSCHSVCSAQTIAKNADKESSDAQFLLTGADIESFSLINDKDEVFEFDRAHTNLFLIPAGKYRIQQVNLKGGYHLKTEPRDWHEIAVDAGPSIKVGAPLLPTVTATREGSVLHLNYELLGVGKMAFTHPDAEKVPTFTVQQGDREIGSGSFEYDENGVCTASWRAPITVLAGDLKVVAFHDIGDRGPHDGPPAIVPWRFYYNTPAVVILGLGVLLLLGICVWVSRRKRQAS
jgi:hypothetical protein